MPASIGVNLRVTGHCRQGGRKYMEDYFTVAYQQTEDEKDLEYAFFGIYDGHGGAEAAAFAKEHLMETIIKHKSFWSENDEDVLRAIKDGYIATHYAMWKEQEKWPKTTSGLPSTAGTTASIAFIRRGKIYVGHVGDSGIVLGYQEPGSSEWKAKPLTKDHKPESPEEMKRIQSCGGKVVSKSGVPRVVWNRPKIGHLGPVRRSTPIDEIPFLAVARSLGDLWSYNSRLNQFVVSPDPDCSVYPIDTQTHRCLIFGTDGLFNMMSPSMAVHIVQQAERHNESAALSDSALKTWLNPSKCLVEKSLERWQATKMRADNTSVVTLMLDPPGPPRAQVLQSRKKNLPDSGLKIMTRYNLESPQSTSSSTSKWSQGVQTTESQRVQKAQPTPVTELPENQTPISDREIYDNVAGNVEVVEQRLGDVPDRKDEKSSSTQTEQVPQPSVSSSDILNQYDMMSNFALRERNFVPKARESTAFDPRVPERPESSGGQSRDEEDNSIQINEISSSNIEETHPEEDHPEESHKEIKSALRSGTKQTVKQPEVKESDRRPSKRKLDMEDHSYVARKSIRLTNSQEKSNSTQNKELLPRKPAPCTLAEEKLKKLAEEAEKTKKLQELQEHNNNHINTRQVNVSVMKTKKVNFKTRQPIRKLIAKKKIQHVFDTVMAKTRRQQAEKKQPDKSDKEKSPEKEKSTEKPSDKSEKPTKADKPIKKAEKSLPKMITTKKISHFKRQSERNASLRNKDVKGKNVVPNIIKKIDAKSEVKENLRGRPKGSKSNIKYVGVRSSTRLSNNAKEIGDSPKMSVSKVPGSKQSPKNKSPVKVVEAKKLSGTKHSLRQRIQKKTESLRRNIQRRS